MISKRIIAPYKGSQTKFLSSPAKETFYGGEAGGGKSMCLILGALRYYQVPDYKAIIFRRTYPDLEYLIGEARQIYTPFGAVYTQQNHMFTFPSGAWIKFNHLQHIKDIYSHQGAQYDYIGFDELPQFPPLAYQYLFSRLRGVNPNIQRFIRATGNPDGEHLLFYKNRFIDKLAPGEIGYFVTNQNKDICVDKGTTGSISRQWIRCIRSENEALTKNDPNYEAMLEQLPEKQKQALKFGKWEQTDKPDQLISTKWFERAISGEIAHKPGRTTFGFDYAERGSDSCCLIIGNGNQPFKGEKTPYLSHREAANKCADIFETYGRYNTYGCVDSVGTGSGVWTALQEMGFNNSIDPLRYKPEEYKRKAGQKGLTINFHELRSAMWYELARDFENGEIDLSMLLSQDNYFEDWITLQQDILAMTYKVVNGVYRVISKNELREAKHLGRSPDVGDALCYWNYARKRARYAIPEVEVHKSLTDYEEEETEERGSAWT